MFLLGALEQQNAAPAGSVLPVLKSWLLTSSGGSQVASLDMVEPSGVVANDLGLILFSTPHQTLDRNHLTTVESGWNRRISYSDSTRDGTIGIFYKVLTAGSGGNVQIDLNANKECFGWFLRISGADLTDPLHMLALSDNPAGTSHPLQEMFTRVTNCLGFYLLSFDGADGDPFSVSGTGWSELDEAESGTGISDTSGCFGTKDFVTRGLTVDAVVTSNVSDGSVGMQLAIAPAGTGAHSALPENQIINGRLLENTRLWKKSNAPLHTYDVTGIDGDANTAITILDNGGSIEYTFQYLDLGAVGATEDWTVRYFVKKQISGDSNNPDYAEFHLRFNTSSSTVIAGDGVALGVNTITGATTARINTGSNGSWTIREYPGNTDWWEIIIEAPNTSRRYIGIAIIPGGSTTLGGTLAGGPEGFIELDNVELYENTVKEDVSGAPNYW